MSLGEIEGIPEDFDFVFNFFFLILKVVDCFLKIVVEIAY